MLYEKKSKGADHVQKTIKNLIHAKPTVHGTTLITYIIPGGMDL
jgi:hypothetical protein